MECRICMSKIEGSPFSVKEMMFDTGKTYLYFKCISCGCLQIEHPETTSENLYPVTYYSFNTYNISNFVRWIKQLTIKYSVAASLGYLSLQSFLFANKNRDCGAHSLKDKVKKNESILDIGCGDGSLIAALGRLGYKQLTGIDPYLAADIIKANHKLLKNNIEDLENDEMYDVIMLHHSFEHVENPFEVMKHINRLLKKDGRCIIRIPVADSYACDFYKENWVQTDAPRHIFLHSNKSMQIVTSQSGLIIESIVDDATEFQFIGSEQYKRGISLNNKQSYYVPPYKKNFFNKKHPFSKSDIKKYRQQAVQLNKEGKGDQRIYYIKKKIG